MNELLARAGAFFVAPPDRVAHQATTSAPAPSCAAVLAAERDVPAAAGAVAATLRARHRAPAAVLCVSAPAGAGAPALPAAAALARRLRDRDLPCSAGGFLCRVHVGAEPEELVRDAWRVLAAVDVPVVVAFSRRELVHDELLAALDLLALGVAPDADPALADVAAASLEVLGPPIARVALPRGAVSRRLAAAGLRRAPLPIAVVR